MLFIFSSRDHLHKYLRFDRRRTAQPCISPRSQAPPTLPGRMSCSHWLLQTGREYLFLCDTIINNSSHHVLLSLDETNLIKLLTRWRDDADYLGWTRLGIPPEHISFVAEDRDAWRFQLKQLPPRSPRISGSRKVRK